MAPAAASIPAAAATSAASNKRPAASDAEQLLLSPDSSSALPQVVDADETTGKTKKQQQLECPRCRSTNTKFCYYNNYSTAQPRHFCRACRRYWTHGGTLRDVPVGGGGANKRRRLSSSSSAEPPSPRSTTTQGAATDLLSTAFPFLSDGTYCLPPQLDVPGFLPLPPLPAAAAASSWVVPDFYDGLAPWDDGTLGVGGDVAGLGLAAELLGWPPPGY